MRSASGYTFREFRIPEYKADGIERYLDHGINPGSFLRAVLENNLKEAVGCADEENLRNLPAFVSYFYNEVPKASWGSPAEVEAWIDAKRGK